jgi:hypothetical protein
MDIARLYADKNITTIPVFEKAPVIWEWNKLPPITDEFTIHDRLELIWSKRYKTASGIGIVLGSESDGLACFDIDSYDSEIVSRLCLAFNAQYIKIGSKGCSFFFVPDFVPTVSMEVHRIPSGGQVEIFFSNKQTVVPPSLYAKGVTDEEDRFYQWVDASCTLLDIHRVSDLPSLSREQLSTIPLLIGSASLMTANKNLPIDLQYNEKGEADGRFLMVKHLIGDYVVRRSRVVKFSDIVAYVLDFDADNFGKNSFFLYEFNKSHKEVKANDSREVNAFRFCTDIISSLDKDNKITFEESVNNVIDMDALNFRDFQLISLESKGTRQPVFRPEYIPAVWRDYITEVEDCYGIPMQVMFFAMLTTLGACLQAKIVIQPYKEDPWFCVPNLTIMILAPSGSKKSDVIKLATYQANIIQSKLNNANGREILDKEIAINSRIEALVRSRKKADSDGEVEESSLITQEIYKEQDKLTELCKGIVQTEWLGELGTIQKMIFDASKNESNGMFLVIDEFNQIRAMKKKKGNEEAHNFFMRMIDGDKSFTTKTFIRGKDTIERCIGSILTSCQPDVFDTIIADLHNLRTDTNDGFMQRFPPIQFGKVILKRTKPLDFRKHKKAFDVFDQAFGMSNRTVHLLSEAHDNYEDKKYLIKERAGRGTSTVISSYLYKHEGMIAKMGYLAEFLRHNGRELGVSNDGLNQGWEWLQYMHDDLLDIFSICDELNDIKEQLQIIEMIKSKVLIDGQTMSQWHQVARGSFKMLDSFSRHLKVLESRGYILMLDLKANSRVMKVNPKLWIL